MDEDIASAERSAEFVNGGRPPPAPPLPPAVDGELAIVDPAEHNVVFTSLVTGDQDVVGLVAYSIYKQNKYDWLMAFSRDQGRMPNEAEAQSYLLGESTSRRLATYRHLAEATLDGRGLEANAAAEPGSRAAAERAPTPGLTDGPGLQRIVLVSLVAVLIVVLGLLWLLHGGFR